MINVVIFIIETQWKKQFNAKHVFLLVDLLPFLQICCEQAVGNAINEVQNNQYLPKTLIYKIKSWKSVTLLDAMLDRTSLQLSTIVNKRLNEYYQITDR